MADVTPDLRGLVAASRPRRVEAGRVGAGRGLPPSWTRAELAGRLTEISGHGATAALTLAVALVVDAQRHAEPAAWIAPRESGFFPPDAAEHGVDLDALVVVRTPDAAAAPRAADKLLRSGAFGLVVMDLGARCDVPMPLLARLAGLAERHDAALVALTRKAAARPSMSPLVSLRVEVRRVRRKDGSFDVEATALRDRRRAAGWTHREGFRGPDGLR